MGIREQILLRVLGGGKACFSGIRASVDLEIIEIFLFYGWKIEIGKVEFAGFPRR